jgi:hypothetical protein
MPDPQPPSVVERNGLRTARHAGEPAPDGSAGRLVITLVPGGATITITLAQAHELIDQLAWQLHRPDLITAHRLMPQRRTQPGTPPLPGRNPS